jgi:malonate transporter
VLLGLTGPALLAAVVTAALPTAQNIFVFASRYRRGEAFARDTIVLSTAVAAVTLIGVVAWLG